MEAMVLDKKYTYEDLQNLEIDEGFFYELLNGEIMQRSAPALSHQRVAKLIFKKLDAFVEKEKKGEVFFAPLDVVLDNYNVLQPDLVFVSEKNSEILFGDYVNGIPDLVVEIISPSSVSRDRIEKKNIYEKFGIPEFWLVDPKNEMIEILVLNKEKNYEHFSYANESGKVKSKILKGFELDLATLFEAQKAD